MEKQFLKFPSINQFHSRAKQGMRKEYPRMKYLIKPKLHGTNASIVLSPNGDIWTQSRKRILDTSKKGDNHGFAKWVDSKELKNPGFVSPLKIVGEWCGGSIQSGKDAICQLDKKVFAVFGIMLNEDFYYGDSVIRNILGDVGLLREEDVWVVPTIGEVNEFTFSDPAMLNAAVEYLRDYVDKMEERDLVVCDKFGVEGPGEGVVFAPVCCNYSLWAELCVKAKTAAHSGNSGNKKRLQKNVPVSEDAVKFADDFATVTRFKQAVEELGIEMDRKNTGKFLKWVNEDILKESKDELEESELDWKECSRIISHRARTWFFSEIAGDYEL